MPLPAALATCVGPCNGGDPIAAAYTRLAVRLFLVAREEARRGGAECLACRVWLMSPDGAAFMEAIGLDPCATQARLLAEWARAGLRRVVLERDAR